MAESLWIIPFGKYRGCPIEDVPVSYLEWLTDQDWFCDQHPEGTSQIGKELAYRERFGGGNGPDDDRNWNRRNK